MDLADTSALEAAIPTGRRLSFRLVKDQGELFSIVAAWEELVDASANPQPMNAPAWLLLWLRHYGAGADLAVGLLYDGDKLVGLAPLCLRNYVYRLGLVFRRLQFMGLDANERDGVFSEYMGLTARKGYESAVASEFVERIRVGDFGSWHELVLGAMDTDNRTNAFAIAALAAKGMVYEQTATMQGYFVRLPRTWDEYLKSLSSTRRYRIRNSLAKFEEWAKADGWTLQRARTTEQLSEGYKTLVALHGERWRQDGSEGAFSSPRFTAFHRDFLAAQFSSYNAEIAWLRVGERPVAAIYTIRNGKKVLAYQYGRIIDAPARVRVGIVINALMIKAAIENGDEEFDFLGGDSRYKVDFATGERPIPTLRVARPTAREFLRVGLINTRQGIASMISRGRSLTGTKPAGGSPGEAKSILESRNPAADP